MKKDIEVLRQKLKNLREERAKITLEKGLAARDNTDLRENALYETLEQKEHLYTSLIINTLKEIHRLSKN